MGVRVQPHIFVCLPMHAPQPTRASDAQVVALWLRSARETKDVEAQDRALYQVEALLAKNQNGKRHGGDGSFTGKLWEQARDLCKQLRSLMLAELDLSEGAVEFCKVCKHAPVDSSYGSTDGMCTMCGDIPF